MPLGVLYTAMCSIDPTSNKSRGYMILGSTDAMLECCGCSIIYDHEDITCDNTNTTCGNTSTTNTSNTDAKDKDIHKVDISMNTCDNTTTGLQGTDRLNNADCCKRDIRALLTHSCSHCADVDTTTVS